MDTSHLNAIRLRLSNERNRLANSSTDAERSLRSIWVAGIERELQGELTFLGLPAELAPAEEAISDEALLAELGV
jgi:hypothetical protein